MSSGKRFSASPACYSIGLDYGTSSVRCLLVNTLTGQEIAQSEWAYEHGEQGVLISRDPNLARQHPSDYLKGTQIVLRDALRQAKTKNRRFQTERIVGIGVGTTGSTPLPVDSEGQPLGLQKRFAKNLAALAWLWKDHTSSAEAEEITALAKQMRPQYVARYGGTYSSEWFFSKILHCLRTSPRIFDASYSWIELADYIPSVLTATQSPDRLTAGVCPAGHKGMYGEDWGGYPDREFLSRLDPRLAQLRARLPAKVSSIQQIAGRLAADWAARTGLPSNIPVAVGALDAHVGAIGAGIEPGSLVKIIGTSACDIAVLPANQPLPTIPGICGIVRDSVLPGFYGLEAGQSAVGDLFNWFVNNIVRGGKRFDAHAWLTRNASKLRPGESGLLALDWNNGNRCLLVDPRLTGLLLGQTLSTTPADIYRALMEATAFGALTIINRLEEFGVKVKRIVACGGIAEKSPLLMQIYADVTGRPIELSGSTQACALGAAVAGAVVGGVHPDFATAQSVMTRHPRKVYQPQSDAHQVYGKLYSLYQRLHDAFGQSGTTGNLGDVMKQLLTIGSTARRGIREAG